MTERYAIYYAPASTSPLWDRAAAWLGRDAATGDLLEGAVAGIDRPRLLNVTQSANRYGFHATLKPPMALAQHQTRESLVEELKSFAALTAPVVLGRLQPESLGGFLALVPREPNEALQDLAANVVETFEPFRAPLGQKARAARMASGLTPRQEELLDAYGYPYVFDEFRFHMTLTDRLDEADRAELTSAVHTWFGPELVEDIVLDRLVLFHEPDTGLPFRRIGDFPLEGQR